MSAMESQLADDELAASGGAEISDGFISLIDMEELQGPRRSEIVQQIGHACQHYGFFLVKNHGISETNMNNILGTTSKFFKLPEQEKLKFCTNDPNKSIKLFMGFKDEIQNVFVARESLRFSTYPFEDYVNEWPANPPSLRKDVMEYCTSVKRVEFALLEAMSESLGLEKDYIDKMLYNHGQKISMNYYPICQEQDPAFIPDNQNGYGLYGQETTQFPTTTKLANAPYTTTTNSQPYKTQTQNQETYTNYPTDTTTNTNTNYYSNNAYDQEQQQNFGEKSLQESGYANMGNQNNNYYYNGANSYSNDEKQGMSDTRYLEKGKYYYDLKGENSNYNPNQYQQDSRNNYNTRGYYSNNNNNENSKFEYNNSMQKYDNQDDFEESKEEQYVP